MESEPSIGAAANDSIVFNCCGKAVKCVHLKATVDLAEYYLNGQGIKTDIGVALELLSDVPERGNSDVMRRLASIYLDGFLVKKDYDIAASFYRKAADEGDPVA